MKIRLKLFLMKNHKLNSGHTAKVTLCFVVLLTSIIWTNLSYAVNCADGTPAPPCGNCECIEVTHIPCDCGGHECDGEKDHGDAICKIEGHKNCDKKSHNPCTVSDCTLSLCETGHPHPGPCSGCQDPGIQHESECLGCDKVSCQVVLANCPESCGKCEKCCDHVDTCNCPTCTEPQKEGGYSFCSPCVDASMCDRADECTAGYCYNHCRHCDCCEASISDNSGQCGSCKGNLCQHKKCDTHTCSQCEDEEESCPLGCTNCEGNCDCSACSPEINDVGMGCEKCVVHAGSKDKCTHGMHTACCTSCNANGGCPCGLSPWTDCSNEAVSGLCDSCRKPENRDTCSCGIVYCKIHEGSATLGENQCIWCYTKVEPN